MPHWVFYSCIFFYSLWTLWALVSIIQVIIHLDDKFPMRHTEEAKIAFLLWLASLVFIINYIITGGS